MIDPISRQIRQARKERLGFPDDEPRQAWLPLLLEATAIVDAGVNEGIRREEKQGRALACRQFNVFGKVCDEGEDAYYTRRADVFTPLREYADAAFDTMLPFYGVAKSAERARLIENGEVHRLAKVLQEYDWPKLVERMQAFDNRRPPG